MNRAGIKQNKVKVYVADCSALADSAVFARCFAAMPAARQEKMEALAREQDKRLSLGAGMLLREVLGERVHDVRVSPNGKPYLPESDLFFNLSHSGDYACLAVGRVPPGCDVEQVRDYSPAVAARFFSQAQQALLAAETDPAKRRELFWRFWTLTEAFLKVTGNGIQALRPAADIPLVLPEAAKCIERQGQVYSLKEYAPAEGYCLSVCAAGEVLFEDALTYFEAF